MASTSSRDGSLSSLREEESSASHLATKASRNASLRSFSAKIALSCGTFERVGSPLGAQHRFVSAYCLVESKSPRLNSRAACATATRPVKRRCPIMWNTGIPFTFCTYSSPSTSAKRLRRASLGSSTLSKPIAALSRSLPTVFLPMSSRMTPGTGLRSSRRFMTKACGPKLLPLMKRSATATVLSATSPCEIQFLYAPRFGECRVNV
mmetsp:Transcript_15747/g.31472  ORF Transcript_15747/g.31472 Transcript_15747/m.31472 type:complete len:207 (+) Transcript_15747:597-1217(+)